MLVMPKRLLVVAILASLLLGGCNDRPASHTYHCADGTTISGPGAVRSMCDGHGGVLGA